MRHPGLAVICIILLGCLYFVSRSSSDSSSALAQDRVSHDVGELGSVEGMPSVSKANTVRRRSIAGALDDVPEPAPWSFRVQIVNTAGQGIAGAALFLREDEGVAHLADADPDGYVDLEFGHLKLPGAVLIARAKNHGTTRHRLGIEPQKTLVLTLPLAATLEGRVVRHDGSAVLAGVHVFAVPGQSRIVSDRLAVADLVGDPEVFVTETDSQGEFSFGGLRPEGHYDLVAGGKGLVMQHAERAVAGVGEQVRLEVLEAYAVVLRFIDSATNTPARIDQGFGPRGRIGFHLETHEAMLIPNNPLSAQLAFMASGLTAGAPHEKLFIAGARTAPAQLGPLKFAAHFAGYERCELELVMRPISELGQPFNVPLQATTQDFGQLVFTLETSSGGGALLARRWGPVGTVSLFGESGAEMQFALKGALIAEHTLNDIPYGRYEVRVRSEPVQWRVPAEGQPAIYVDISEESTSLTMQAESFGAIGVELFAPDGSEYTGEAVFFLGLGEPKRTVDGRPMFSGSRVNFERAPYILPLVSEGVYGVLLESPASRETWSLATVHRGELATVTLHINP